MSFEVPILFLVFNRPETTQQIFNRIREVRPKKLFVAADGPRKDRAGEKEICEEVRQIILSIDWECELHTLFREDNLGCGISVSSAITWFFENVDEGIILEDDCLPSITFFKFCQKMLNAYRNSEQVFMISGFSVLQEEPGYFFHQNASIWGWATWKRSWEKYDYDFLDFGENVFAQIQSPVLREFHKGTLLGQLSKNINTWDIQMALLIYQLNNYTISPTKSLIQNIGIQGTHANGRQSLVHSILATEWEKTPLVRTFNITNEDRRLAKKYLKYINKNIKLDNQNSLYNKIISKVKRLLSDKVSKKSH